MKKIYLIAVFLGLQIVVTSCSEEFLEVDPKSIRLESEYYKNPDEAFNGLVAAYDPMGWEGESGAGGYATFPCLVAASDEAYAGGGSSSDVWFLQVMNNYNLLDPANGPQLGYWDKGFTGVSRVNTLLSKLEEGIPGLPDALRARYVAEAKFLRGYYYFDLVRLFGNVPLITRPISKEEFFTITQATPEAVYAQIEQDLKDALTFPELPDMVTGDERGRVTKGMAHALLGKVYLYEEKWDDAAKHLAEVNGVPGGTSRYGYKLLDDFNAIFRPDNEFHTESILEIGHTAGAASGWGNTSKVEGLVAAKMFGPRSYNGPLYYSGWGGCPVTPEFNDLMEGDPRYETTIMDVAGMVEAGEAAYVPGYQDTGLFFNKFAPLKEFENTGAGSPTLNYTQNYIEIRLADTYLMEAEALLQSGGDLARAEALLNAVRGRVGLDPVAATLENIYHERRLELASEGHRWYDLVRTGRAATVLADDGFTAGKNEILPIPLEELSNTQLVQNPGY